MVTADGFRAAGMENGGMARRHRRVLGEQVAALRMGVGGRLGSI